MLQSVLHYSLHLIVPAGIAWLFFRKNWKRAYLIMLATMLVDLDHVVADPIFQANRCSINFHPLHTYYAMIAYTIMLFINRTIRIVGIGLLWHMITDLSDCMFMYHKCAECLQSAPAYPLLEWLSN